MSKKYKLSYDDETGGISDDTGLVIAHFSNEAHTDWPEDLTWYREIGGLVQSAYNAGIERGKFDCMTSLEKAEHVALKSKVTL